MKGADASYQVGEVSAHRGIGLKQPFLQLWIRQFQKLLEVREVGLAKIFQVSIGIAADEPIHFLCAAVAGTVGGAALSRFQIAHWRAVDILGQIMPS